MGRHGEKLNVLVTGGSGFIGRKLVEYLCSQGHRVSVLSRTPPTQTDNLHIRFYAADLTADTVEDAPFEKADLLVHLAGSASGEPELQIEDCTNVRAAKTISRKVVTHNIQRTIVVSSIYARFAEEGNPAARRYGAEKLLADQIFLDAIVAAHQQVVILRPPAVYGAGMKGRLATLGKLIHAGLPLPLGLAKGAREYISVKNMVDAICVVAQSDDGRWETASANVFEISDGKPINTADLCRAIGTTHNKPARLLPMPLSLLRLLGRLTGRGEMVSGTIEPVSMRTAPSFGEVFDWQPVEQMPESLSFLSRRDEDA